LTGWLRSVYAGAAVAEGIGTHVEPRTGRFAWDASELVFVVREPWPSKTTGGSIVTGTVTRDAPLMIESRMAEGGVIFSDAIESDYLAFTAGLTATVGISNRIASRVNQPLRGQSGPGPPAQIPR
jgi:hypothetical protein